MSDCNYGINDFINFGNNNDVGNEFGNLPNTRKFSQDTSTYSLDHTKLILNQIDKNYESTNQCKNQNTNNLLKEKNQKIQDHEDDASNLGYENVIFHSGKNIDSNLENSRLNKSFNMNDLKEEFSSNKRTSTGNFPNNNIEILDVYGKSFSPESQTQENSQRIQIIPFTKALNTFMTKEGTPAALKIVINKSNAFEVSQSLFTNEFSHNSQLFDLNNSNKASLSKDNLSTKSPYKITISKTEQNFNTNQQNLKSSAEEKSDTEYTKMVTKARKLKSYWNKENGSIPNIYKIVCHQERNHYFEMHDLSCKNLMNHLVSNYENSCSYLNEETEYNEDSILIGKRSKMKTDGKMSVSQESTNFSNFKMLKIQS